MRILVATSQIPFTAGGAEIHVAGLVKGLGEAGHEVEKVAIPFKWYPPEQILDHMLACRLLDLSEVNGRRIDRVIALKFPAYFIPHENKTLWILHQHRQAYEQWNHPQLGDLKMSHNGQEIRDAIRAADRRYIPEARSVFANSRNVSDRLRSYCGIPSIPLYHPPEHPERFECRPAHNYFLLPGRLTPAKRQKLAVEALALTRHPCELVICGAAESAEYTRSLLTRAESAGVGGRLRILGHVSTEDKLTLYAHALAVVYPPFDEDYGYVTLEAMLASKALITCTDSGGPLEFVIDGETGRVVEPSAAALADAMDTMAAQRAHTAAMGRAGRAHFLDRNITWSRVIEELTAE